MSTECSQYIMKANYHTHTVRCNHATGTERDYIEQALARNLEVIGFSDHSPQVFDGYVSGFRMLPDQLEDYVTTLQGLRKEYEGRIRILIGLEAEYYPKYFERLIRLIEPFHLDYLILGQHFMGNECNGEPSCTRPTDDEKQLEQYVRQTVEAMETGVFSCFAHPDVFRFTGEDRIYRKWAEKLCVRARELNIPLEMNMLGYVTNRHYPNASFFETARDVGNELILGCDAHDPVRVADPSEVDRCLFFLRSCGIERINEEMRLVPPAMG